MKTIRTRWMASALVAVSLLVSAGCAADGDGKSGSDASASGGGAAGKKTTITFWSWIGGIEEVVKTFNASQNDIEVKLEVTPSGVAGGYLKLTNAITAGNAPDLATIEYTNLPEYVSQGGLQPIGNLVDASVLKDYPKAITDQATFDGKVWGMPYDATPMVMYYRKDLLAQHGIEVPRTWDDYAKAAAKFHTEDPAGYLGSYFPNEPTQLAAYSWAAGAKWFGTANNAWQVNLTDPKTTEVGAYWQKLKDDKTVLVEKSWSENWGKMLKTDKLATVIGPPWAANNLAANTAGQTDKWAVAPLPSFDGKASSGFWGGSTFAVSKDSKNAKAAATFATWLTHAPESINARTSNGRAVYPAHPAAYEVAAKNFKSDLFGTQDIFQVFKAADASVPTGWMWGPAMNVTATTLGDEQNSHSIPDAFKASQQATIDAMRKRNLNVTGG
ncbi:ABC transporter substrate-binding protein [Streptodolium elevatio]|uniref:Sugar ABC transporter substrate-binding protein n=1 Tax=Streptodolium elevatio TaxID=3157996 RepID=A0ABV3DRZ6_9ACTN